MLRGCAAVRSAEAQATSFKLIDHDDVTVLLLLATVTGADGDASTERGPVPLEGCAWQPHLTRETLLSSPLPTLARRPQRLYLCPVTSRRCTSHARPFIDNCNSLKRVPTHMH